MVRVIGGIVAGLVVALAATLGIGWINEIVYPALGNVPVSDRVRLGEMMLALPVGAQLIVAAAWLVGALVGGWVAGAISLRGWTVWLITAFVALVAVVSVMAVSYPMLLRVASVVAPVLGGLGARLLLRRTPSAGMGAPA